MPFYEPVSAMKFCFFLSSLNPLSLMKSTRFFLNFIFLFSLLGLGSLGWGERYQTIFVSTESTASMNSTEALEYMSSSLCKSSQYLTLGNGETATVFASGASTRPNSILNLISDQAAAYVYGIEVDVNGLESNTTKRSWNPNDQSPGIANINSDYAGNLVGPATIRVIIKPWSGRGNTTNYWYSLDNDTWAFQASEGFVTFKISGAEEAPSKKFATVIPENASGNIRVVLEQSTDLINWTSATPGVFAPSTSKRFFRVRSEEE